MEGSQPPFGCGDQSILETLVVMPKDSVVMADLLDVNDGSGLYGDFQLPEFPCMLSSSTTLAPIRPPGLSSTLLSSSSTSWMALGHDSVTAMDTANCAAWNVAAPVQSEVLFPTPPMGIILKKPSEDADEAALAAASSTVDAATFSGAYDCLHVMENLGNTATLESNDMFDQTLIFQSGNPFNEEVHDMGNFGLDCEDQKYQLELIGQHGENENNGVVILDRRCNEVGGLAFSDDIGAVFQEWLHANRGSISPDFLQKVKIKKSTIEMALRLLGGGKEAIKQLLKLILQWLQTNHLDQKHTVELSPSDLNLHQQIIPPSPSSRPKPNPNPNFVPSLPVSTTFPDFPDASDSSFASQWGLPPSPFVHPNMNPNSTVIGTHLGSESLDFNMVDSMQLWPPAVQWPQYEYTENFHPTLGGPPQGFGGCGYGDPSQYPVQYFGSGRSSRLKFARLGSAATKEARKNRMAQQKRSQSHQQHRVSKSRQQDGSHHKVMAEQGGGIIGSEVYCADMSQLDSNANWMYWPPDIQGDIFAEEHLQVQAAETSTPENHYHPQNFTLPDRVQQPNRNQGLKQENNLKFLLQKVLKQSDVGNLGRIVLPKKEAEAHLPELEARDGITIVMEDIGTSRVWNMRYRFWPNNKSRMYLLENTGDFVRANGLKEGDFIVIYSDLKCGKYLIRGVKMHPPEEDVRA